MIIKCRYCGKEAVVRIPFARLNLCSDHFKEFIVSKVKNTILRYKMIEPGDRVILAVSGGKDSVALAHIMHSISTSLNFKLAVLHIDLGIGEYSRKSREVVEYLCKELGLDYYIVDLKNYLNFTLPEFISRLRTRRICSLCGTIKRYMMNAIAVELGANSVATAHHADDILTYIFKNFILQDYNSLKKLIPINKGMQGIAVRKIKPMYEIYENHTALYTLYSNLKFVDMECPYKKVKSLENNIRKFLNELENTVPGIKISILRKFAQTYLSQFEDTTEFKSCRICGLISQKDVCTFCKLTEKSFGKPLGITVREKLRNIS
ncbi:MAG: TIGR00269 family protein [Ignisphaera sp.]